MNRHALLVKLGLDTTPKIATQLLNTYVAIQSPFSLAFAQQLFDQVPVPNKDAVLWSSLISAYARYKLPLKALQLFSIYNLQSKSTSEANPFIYATAAHAISSLPEPHIHLGRSLHAQVIKHGFFPSNVVVETAFLDMYSKCGLVGCARKVFDEMPEKNLVTWNAMVAGSCLSQEDDVIIGCALIDMYAKCSSVSAARKVFDTSGFPQQIPHCNAMINGYVYNGLIQEARALFEDMAEKSVVSFTSLMTGYVQNDMLKEALELLAQMYSAEDANRIEGNSYTFVVGLEACTQMTDLNRGKQIHAKIIRRLPSVDLHNPILGTMLIDMYAKAASVRYAQSVFNSMVEKNVFAWTSIITCYALHGDSSHALQLFKEMIDNGVEPNEVTFVSVLSACSHCGLVKEGLGYFKTMTEKYGLVPREDHFTCLIDMLGRVGRLGEAWEILEEVERVKMHQSASTQSILAAMAGACQLHGNVDLGRRIAAKLLKKREQPSSTHIALSNVYASAGLWQEAYQVRETGKRGGDLDLEPGISRIWTSTGNTTW